MKKFCFFVFTVFVCISLWSGNKKLKVFVSIEPQRFFVKKIAGDKVNVQTMLPTGSSPATYEPTPHQMVLLSKASLFFRIGVPFENALIPKIEKNFKNLKIIDTRKGIVLRVMESSKPRIMYVMGKNKNIKPPNKFVRDPHIWLNPILVKIQAENIMNALKEADPINADFYEKNCKKFQDDLDLLNKELKEAFSTLKMRFFMVFHPAWGYFADAYGLKQIPVELEGKQPSARYLARMLKKAKSKGIKIIFAQPQFSSALAKKIANSLDGTVVFINPLAYDYFKNMHHIAETIKKSLER